MVKCAKKKKKAVEKERKKDLTEPVLLEMAGFQLTLHGRIWVTPEVWLCETSCYLLQNAF